MLRFFRLLRRKLLEEGHIRKYFWYALGEILLVMIGILLALQVNNWNQNRKELAREQSILMELNSDFKHNAEQLEFIAAGHLKSLESVEWLLEHHPDYEVENDSLLYHLNYLHSAYTFNPSQSTVQSLINTSSFYLIRNEELRRKLMIWSDLFHDYAEEEFIAREVFMQMVIPYMHENVDMNFLRDVDPVPLEDIEGLQTMEFKNLLITRKVTIAYNILYSTEDELQRLQEVIQDIIELTEVE